MMSPCNKIMSFFIKPWVMVLAVSLIAFCFFFIDKPLAEFFFNIDLRHNYQFLELFTKLGAGFFYFSAFILGIFIFRYIRVNTDWEAKCWFLLLCVLVPSSICGFLKVVLGRARPSMLLEGQYFGFYGFQTHSPFWSFPSGHTTTIMSVAAGLSLLYPRSSSYVLTVGFLVAVSRIILNHHYLSDVLAATYLVFIELAALLWVLRKKKWLESAWQNSQCSMYGCSSRTMSQ
ncbi:phosphatase PAP2 family protein [Legionella genomosp. 1]|uniref:phosphatase PAP2 family protein n=1 Tax=Legionella genomosp. 1 TaxID=1093625 RepID=UPI0013EFB2AE|nr:phosphatase PAP2 family protein [Legionella genomosp. 1]